jgi:hypothetical protein
MFERNNATTNPLCCYCLYREELHRLTQNAVRDFTVQKYSTFISVLSKSQITMWYRTDINAVFPLASDYQNRTDDELLEMGEFLDDIEEQVKIHRDLFRRHYRGTENRRAMVTESMGALTKKVEAPDEKMEAKKNTTVFAVIKKVSAAAQKDKSSKPKTVSVRNTFDWFTMRNSRS